MFDVTYLFVYRIMFMLELLCGEAVFIFVLERKKHFLWRFIGSVIVCFAAATLFPIFFYNAWYSSFMFLCLFAVTVGMMKFCFEAPFKNILFCAVAGFTVQHFVHETVELINTAFNLQEVVNIDFYGSGQFQMADFVIDFSKNVIYFSLYYILYGLVYLGSYFLFSKQLKRYNIFGMNMSVMLPLVGFILIVDILFGALVMYSDSSDSALQVSLLHVYNIACCVLALIIMIELPKRKSLEHELVATRSLAEKEKKQYNISKENIELINVKCHDIKHQIREMKKQKAIGEDVVKELESLVDIYDCAYKTSNKALNVILSEKSMICKNRQVELSCILDGESLSFVSDADIYSLFGNLLDNCLEAVGELEADSRVISVSVNRTGGLVRINVYNNFDHSLVFENGLPVTIKESSDVHGFGLKSVRRIVEKYGGGMTITADNGIFEVNIVLPYDEQKTNIR